MEIDNKEFVQYVSRRTVEFAIYEYKKGPSNDEKLNNYYLSAKRFLKSDWFDDLCLLMGLDSRFVKRKVLKDLS